MRLAIYVPKAQADFWSGDSPSFGEFQRKVVDMSGGITVTSAEGSWKGPTGGYVREPVFVVEALIRLPDSATYKKAWEVFRTYANQLIAQGEESVLIVQDNEPTYVTA